MGDGVINRHVSTGSTTCCKSEEWLVVVAEFSLESLEVVVLGAVDLCTCHYLEVVGIVEAKLIGCIHVGSPLVLAGVALVGVGVLLEHHGLGSFG